MNEHNRLLTDWDACQVALAVAEAGTVSGAAARLGIHHATVIRRIDQLESQLGARLFQRTPRGYLPTDAGAELLRVASAVRDQLGDLAGRLRGMQARVSGRLVVTALDELSPLLVPVLVRFQRAHPDVTVELIAEDRLLRLDQAEAHVAIRAGAPHATQDMVVQKLGRQAIALYASRDYLARHGRPERLEDLARHRVVGFTGTNLRAPFLRWLAESVPEEAITFRIGRPAGAQYAIQAGAGIGFMARWQAARLPGVEELFPPRKDWGSDLWILTHVDLHRTTKVQAFLTMLKQEAREWPWL